MCIGRHETYPSFFCQILMKLEFSRQVLEKSLFHENSFRGAPVVPCGRTDTTKLIDALVGRDTSVDIATRYGLDGPGIGSGGDEFSASVQTGPGVHPAYTTMCTGSFLGVKRSVRDVDHPPPSSVEVKERVELYICFPFGPS